MLELPCFNVAPGGGRVERRLIPVQCAYVSWLPEGLDALLVTSDLQGYDSVLVPPEQRRLLGVVMAEACLEAAARGLMPPAAATGVVLPGDYWARPKLKRRGGIGDVDEVWEAFGTGFRWVVGVAGNHDHFDGEWRPGEAFGARDELHVLDGDEVELDGLRIGGVSGIIGEPRKKKPFQREKRVQKAMIRERLAASPDILVLHEGPSLLHRGFRGRKSIRKALLGAESQPLVVCGHKNWRTPLGELEGGMQVLNVDSRAVVLVRG